MENYSVYNNFEQATCMTVPMIENKEGQWLKPTEVAKQLGISERTVHRLVERGELSAYRIGGSLKFRYEDIEEYLQSSRINRKSITE